MFSLVYWRRAFQAFCSGTLWTILRQICPIATDATVIFTFHLGCSSTISLFILQLFRPLSWSHLYLQNRQYLLSNMFIIIIFYTISCPFFLFYLVYSAPVFCVILVLILLPELSVSKCLPTTRNRNVPPTNKVTFPLQPSTATFTSVKIGDFEV